MNQQIKLFFRWSPLLVLLLWITACGSQAHTAGGTAKPPPPPHDEQPGQPAYTTNQPNIPPPTATTTARPVINPKTPGGDQGTTAPDKVRALLQPKTQVELEKFDADMHELSLAELEGFLQYDPLSSGPKDCPTARRALRSLRKAVDLICSLTEKSKPTRCESAKEKLKSNQERVEKACGTTTPSAPNAP
jgi:hypothetical protein